MGCVVWPVRSCYCLLTKKVSLSVCRGFGADHIVCASRLPLIRSRCFQSLFSFALWPHPSLCLQYCFFSSSVLASTCCNCGGVFLQFESERCMEVLKILLYFMTTCLCWEGGGMEGRREKEKSYLQNAHYFFIHLTTLIARHFASDIILPGIFLEGYHPAHLTDEHHRRAPSFLRLCSRVGRHLGLYGGCFVLSMV